MNRKKRTLFGILLTLAFAISFFMLGAFLAGKLGMAKSQGLAGGAIVLGYGLIAGIIGIILGVVLSRFLSARWLVTLCIFFGLVASVLFWRIFTAVSDSRSQSRAQLEQAYDNFPKFQVLIVQSDRSHYLSFERMQMDWANRNYQLSADGKQCTVEMSGEQALKMLSALRPKENTVLDEAFPCAASPTLECKPTSLLQLRSTHICCTTASLLSKLAT